MSNVTVRIEEGAEPTRFELHIESRIAEHVFELEESDLRDLHAATEAQLARMNLLEE